MLAKTFMILLTMGSDGEMSGAFAVQDSMDACENKLPAIVHTIESSVQSGSSKILESGCISGDWPFTPFSHTSRPDTVNSFYFVDFRKADSLVIIPMANTKACAFTKEKSGLALDSKSRAKLYCVSSYQGWTKKKPTAKNK